MTAPFLSGGDLTVYFAGDTAKAPIVFEHGRTSSRAPSILDVGPQFISLPDLPDAGFRLVAPLVIRVAFEPGASFELYESLSDTYAYGLTVTGAIQELSELLIDSYSLLIEDEDILSDRLRNRLELFRGIVAPRGEDANASS